MIYRLPLLRARNELDSWVSREAAFLVNNWILLFSAFFVLFATMFPTLSEAVTGERLTVGPPFFNKWMLPIGLILLLLTGVGPLLAWRKSTLVEPARQFLWPVAAGAGRRRGTLVALGVRVWASGLCFALCAFVVGTIAQEFWRGAQRPAQDAPAPTCFTALIGLVGRNKRRYGGYIVHVGIVLMFLGFAGEGFKQDEQVLLKPGQQTTVGHFTVRHDALQRHRRRPEADDHRPRHGASRTASRSTRCIRRSGSSTSTKTSRRPRSRSGGRSPRTSTSCSPAFDARRRRRRRCRSYVNPLVNWIWLGFGIMALGTGIALLPERAFAFALAKLPAEAATTTAALLLALMLARRPPLSAQQDARRRRRQTRQTSFYARNAVREAAAARDHLHLRRCGHADHRRVPQGSVRHVARDARRAGGARSTRARSHDEIIQAFVTKYGSQEMLGAPIDKGFNRLAWLFPYLLGAGGAGRRSDSRRVRWSRKDDVEPGSTQAATDPALDARLDDELRDLD